MCGRACCGVGGGALCKKLTIYSNNDNDGGGGNNGTKQTNVKYVWDKTSEEKWTPRFNIGPKVYAPVIINDGVSEDGMTTQRKIKTMSWGLVPSWHPKSKTIKDFKMSMFNARIESILSKGSFKKPLEKGQRCIFVIEGFYEWEVNKDTGEKTPYYIFLKPQPNTNNDNDDTNNDSNDNVVNDNNNNTSHNDNNNDHNNHNDNNNDNDDNVHDTVNKDFRNKDIDNKDMDMTSKAEHQSTENDDARTRTPTPSATATSTTTTTTRATTTPTTPPPTTTATSSSTTTPTVHQSERRLMMLAGFYDCWQGKEDHNTTKHTNANVTDNNNNNNNNNDDGNDDDEEDDDDDDDDKHTKPAPHYSSCVITMASAPNIRWLHDRMPAILTTEDKISQWLDPNISAVKALSLLDTSASEQLEWYPVSDAVGNIRYDEADCRTRAKPKPKPKQKKDSFLMKWITSSPSKPKNTLPKLSKLTTTTTPKTTMTTPKTTTTTTTTPSPKTTMTIPIPKTATTTKKTTTTTTEKRKAGDLDPDAAMVVEKCCSVKRFRNSPPTSTSTPTSASTPTPTQTSTSTPSTSTPTPPLPPSSSDVGVVARDVACTRCTFINTISNATRQTTCSMCELPLDG